MKKMIKKSVAALIAVLMVISTMPFTAVTAMAADDAAKKADVISKINAGFSGYQGEASAPADNTMSKSNLAKNTTYGVDDKMQNVLYQKAINDGPWTSSVASVGTSKSGAITYNVDTGLQYGDIAFLYDGQTCPAAVVASYFTSNSKEGGMRSLDPNTSGFEMKTAWHSSGSTSKDYSTISDWCFGNGYYKQIGSIVSGAFGQSKNNRYFYNSLYYTGTPSETVTTVKNIEWNITVYSSSSSYDNKTGSITFGNSNATSGTTTIYVVNYKPVYDAIANIKNIYNNQIKGKESEFCADSLTAFYNAAYDIMNLNPNDSKYNYSSDLSAAVNSVGADIDALATQISTVNAGPTKHTAGTATRENEVAATCSAEGSYDEVVKCTNCGAEISRTQKTIPIDPDAHHASKATKVTVSAATCVDAEIYDLVSYCDYCNKEISRMSGLTGDPATGVHDYSVYTEKDADKHTVSCSVCGDSYEEEHTYAEGSNVCTKCGYVALDKTAYNKAVAEAMDIIANGATKYTSESFKAYSEAIEAAMKESDAADTQAKLDVVTSKILSAKSLLAKAQVTITFKVQNDDTDTETTETKTVAWGETVELDSKSSKVSKWTVDVNGTTSVAANAESVYSHVATEDATIIAYVSNEESETVQYSKVVFYGKNNAIVGIVYVPADGTPVTTSSLFTAPEVPFYNFLGWDKADITADGSEISVKASYAPKSETEDKCGIWLNGQFVKSYSYDSYVYLFGADKSKKYAMYSDEACTELITYFDGVDFYSPHIDNLYIKEVSYADRKATVGFTGSFKNGNTSSFNVKFWLPEGATLVETGVDWNVTMEDGRVGSGHDRATKFSQRNEYTYNATFSAAKKTVKFTPYVTYTVGGNKTTVYGTSQTVEY